ncbi:MAG TPA: NAD(P)/FAD-dependent oxidoreductase, partial [Gemmataceae bacterium]|nr:NAD(P)/FAD-dependent oxidoreductase [Gemmataceae bacterium]
LLYQVATAALSPADIAYPIRRIFRRHANVRVVLGQVDRIDLARRQVCGGDVCVDYDYLAVCAGATHSYFGKDEAWRTIAPGLKDLDDATEIRRRVLLAFEEAELEQDEASRRAKLTFVVVGGGPTGVEMAGALREIAANDIQKDFRNIDTGTSRVILVQGGDRLLEQFDPKLSERARRDLEAMGVEVRLNARVTNVDETGVFIGSEHLPAQNIVWAAGVAAPKLVAAMGVPTDRSGRAIVGPDLSVPGHPNVFVLGDAASVTDAVTGKPVPGLAPAAMQMGKFVAKVIAAELAAPSGTTPPPPRPAFHYRDKGIMATIGTHRAVADIKGWRFGGVLAWLAWSLIHVMFLIGFRNRFFVMAGWVYDYFANNREARLITGTFKLRVRNPRRSGYVHLQPAAAAAAPELAAPAPPAGAASAPAEAAPGWSSAGKV